MTEGLNSILLREIVTVSRETTPKIMFVPTEKGSTVKEKQILVFKSRPFLRRDLCVGKQTGSSKT